MTNPRKFVIGDIHSHFDEMNELFNRIQFNFDIDLLISLWDLVDRGPNPIEVIETLMQVKNFIHILGNHDDWCYQYLKYREIPREWESQGGLATLKAYAEKTEVIENHIKFFENAKLFYIDENERLYIHGGFNHRIPFSTQTDNKEILIWDRSLVITAMEYSQSDLTFNEFNEIFVGHTPTQFIKESTPQKFSNLWMLDTGVYLSGKLTIMNVETKEFWQSAAKNKNICK
ncbi:MAG: metallophosphoesterase [Candidatus Paceibacterota bacterium]